MFQLNAFDYNIKSQFMFDKTGIINIFYTYSLSFRNNSCSSFVSGIIYVGMLWLKKTYS